ncbi:MAG: VOC family protein [Mycobacterium sp.]|nr:VOC family protein [Mycobacterium sp.]
MPEQTQYAAGTPNWVTLLAPDIDAAQRFYGAVFGWNFQTEGPAEMQYVLCVKQGHAVAGMVQRPDDPDTPIAWQTLLATDNLDATVQAAQKAGARVVSEPMDVPERGRLAVVIDPTGASIGFWQATGYAGAELMHEPGAMTWNELRTPDPKTSEAFYGKLFPYEFEQAGDGETFDYALFKVNGSQVGGRMRSPGESAYWLPYFSVDEVDKAATRVMERGGKIISEPQDTPYGRMAACEDPWGARFSIVTLPDS